jgi:steroid delta-isomerase-like uncharacterized protein
MSPDEMLDKFQRIWDEVWHLPEKTAGAIGQSFADHLIYRISSLENPINKKAFAQFVPVWQRAFPDGRMKTLDVTATDDKVWCYWLSTGTHSAEYLGIPATGRQVAYQGVTIYRFNPEGQIAEVWDVPDVLTLLRQLGAIPQ